MSSSLPGRSWFEDEAQSTANQIAEFGEDFEVQPHTQRPNMPSCPDLTRPTTRWLRAVFEREGRNVKAGEDGLPISSRDPIITYLRCDLPYEVRRSDRLVHRITGEVFEVTNPVKDGLSGVRLEVVQLGRAR